MEFSHCCCVQVGMSHNGWIWADSLSVLIMWYVIIITGEKCVCRDGEINYMYCFWFWDNQICKDWTDYLRVVFFPQKRNVMMSCFVTVLSQWMSNKHGNCEGYTSYRDYILCLFIHSLHLFRLICFKTFSFVKKHQSLSAFLLTCKSRINTASKTWTKTEKC